MRVPLLSRCAPFPGLVRLRLFVAATAICATGTPERLLIEADLDATKVEGRDGEPTGQFE